LSLESLRVVSVPLEEPPVRLKETDLRFSTLSISPKLRVSRFARLICAGLAAVVGVAAFGNDTQNAIANGDTRTISLYHTHRKDSITVTFKRGGYYDKAALSKLNYFLRDWRNDQQTNMDPRLFDVLWESYSEAGIRSAVHVVSAYRSPATNAMLRRRSRGVAKHSQHMLGKAMDTTVPGASMARVREVGMRLQMGGVGFYPRSNTPFVHLDVGNVRSWPRMSRSQLARLFPDGRTVHLPREGGTMPGYQLALADIQRFGRGAGGSEGEDGDGGRGFFEALFGGGTDEGENYGDNPNDNSALAVAMRDAKRKQNAGAIQVASAAPAAPQRQAKARPAVPVEQPKAAEPEALIEPATLTPSPKPKPETPAAEPEVQVALVDPQSLQPKLAAQDERANVPLPPRRPGNLATIAAASPDDGVPMPPQRPGAIGALALAEPDQPIDAAAPGEDATGIVPELGPAEVLRAATTTSGVPRPLDEPQSAPKKKNGAVPSPPPLRVAGIPSNSEGPLVRSLVAEPKAETSDDPLPKLILEGQGKAEATESPGPSLAAVPLPPERPAKQRASKAVAAKAEPAAPVVKIAARPENPAAGTLRIKPSEGLIARPKKKAAPVIASGFTKDSSALAAGAFTGSVVRPLGAKFVKQDVSAN
jgi:uncharacterized protein YcbK (DUF882 family)